MSDAVEVYRFDARDMENLHQALRCGRSGVRVEVEHIRDCNGPHAATLWLAALRYLAGQNAHVRLVSPGNTRDPLAGLITADPITGLPPSLSKIEEGIQVAWWGLADGIEIVSADSLPPLLDQGPCWDQ